MHSTLWKLLSTFIFMSLIFNALFVVCEQTIHILQISMCFWPINMGICGRVLTKQNVLDVFVVCMCDL